MNRFFTLLLAATCLTAVGQVTYPYNPDGNADGDIAVGDLQDFLVTYGNPFSPSEIMVGDTALSDWVYLLDSSLTSLQSEVSPVVFGERQLIQLDSLQWTEIQSPNRLVTELAFGQDGLLILGTNCFGPSLPVEVFVHPVGIVPCGESIFDCEDAQINTFFESGQFLDYQYAATGLTVAVRASEKVAFRKYNSSDDCVDQTIWWLPLKGASSQTEDSNLSGPNSPITPLGVLDESVVPEPVDNGCTKRAILREDLNLDFWNENSTLGATENNVLFFDGDLKLWMLNGDNNLSIFSTSLLGPAAYLNTGASCNVDGELSKMQKYLSDTLVVLGVGFNSNLNCGLLRGVHIARSSGDVSHINFEVPNPFNNVQSYGNVQFDYPWLTWNDGNNRFFLNVLTEEYLFLTGFGRNGILDDGKLLFVDDDLSQSSNPPDFGLLKSFDISSQITETVLDLKETPEASNWSYLHPNGSTYVIENDFALLKGAEGIAIFKSPTGQGSDGSREVLLIGEDGTIIDEYRLEAWNGAISTGTPFRFGSEDSDWGFYFQGSGTSHFVLDSEVYSTSSTALILNPWSKAVFPPCLPRTSATYPVSNPTVSSGSIWPFVWRLNIPSYVHSLGIEAVWFY